MRISIQYLGETYGKSSNCSDLLNASELGSDTHSDEIYDYDPFVIKAEMATQTNATEATEVAAATTSIVKALVIQAPFIQLDNQELLSSSLEHPQHLEEDNRRDDRELIYPSPPKRSARSKRAYPQYPSGFTYLGFTPDFPPSSPIGLGEDPGIEGMPAVVCLTCKFPHSVVTHTCLNISSEQQTCLMLNSIETRPLTTDNVAYHLILRDQLLGRTTKEKGPKA